MREKNRVGSESSSSSGSPDRVGSSAAAAARQPQGRGPRIVSSFTGPAFELMSGLRVQYPDLDDSERLMRLAASSTDPFEQAMAEFDRAAKALYQVVPQPAYDFILLVQAYLRNIKSGALDAGKLLKTVQGAVSPLVVWSEETAPPIVRRRGP